MMPRVAQTSRRFLSGCVRPNWAYNPPVPMQRHYYGLNHLHYEHLDREEGAREIKLHAQQPGEEGVGEGARRLAVVELEVLFSA